MNILLLVESYVTEPVDSKISNASNHKEAKSSNVIVDRDEKGDSNNDEGLMKSIKRFVRDGGYEATQEIVAVIIDFAKKIWLITDENSNQNSITILQKKKKSVQPSSSSSSQSTDDIFGRDQNKGKAKFIRQKREISYQKILLLIDTLFTRSKDFRAILSQNEHFQKMLTEGLVNPAGGSKSSSLEFAKRREALLSNVEKWDNEYGEHVPQLRVIVRHLKENLGITFPSDRNTQKQSATTSSMDAATAIISKIKILEKEMSLDASSPYSEVGKKLSEAEVQIKSFIPDVFADLFFPTQSSISKISTENSKKRTRDDELVSSEKSKKDKKEFMSIAEKSDNVFDDSDIVWEDEAKDTNVKADIEESIYHLPDDYEIVVTFKPGETNSNPILNMTAMSLKEIKIQMESVYLSRVEKWIKDMKEMETKKLKENGKDVSPDDAIHWNNILMTLMKRAVDLRENIMDLVERCNKLGV